MTSPEDEIRFTLGALRLLRDNVESRLLDRGWAITDLDIADDEALEWFWSPTAPVPHGTERRDEPALHRTRMHGPRHTPWKLPTRITRAGSRWRLEYGEANAQEPDAPREYADGEELLADLERIECWPMTLEETREIRMKRLYAVTSAVAHDDHYLGLALTEPYASRIERLHEHLRFEAERARGSADAKPPATLRPRGDLRARLALVDAEAWASALRTARAGGEGWGIHGPEES